MKNMIKRIVIPGLIFGFLTGRGFAQDVDLEKIVVTPSRVEESTGDVGRQVDVVTSQDIADSGSQDLADALTNLTSVNISTYGGPNATKNIRMRGSTSAQVLVMVDGRPINNPRDGEADISNIPLDNIERVEVMHGPGSSLYGSSAMGGVVNIITKNPPKEGMKTELYSSFGTARTYTERMLNGAKIANFSYIASGQYQSSQGFRDNSELNAKDCNLKLEYALNNQNNLTLNSGFYKSKVGTPGPASSPDLDDKQNTLNRFFDLNWNFQPDEQTGISARTYQNYDRLEFVENSPDYTKNIHTTVVRGLDLQVNRELMDNYQIVGGFNYVKNLNDSTSSAKHHYDVRSGYLENRFDLFDKKVNLNLSARVDDYSNFGTEFNPGLSILYKVTEEVKLHGSVNRSYRAPTFNDLYWPFNDYGPSYKEKGNPNLSPEKGVTEEIGIDARINKYLTSGLTYYHSDYKQLIQWSKDETNLWQPMNVSSAIIDGLEFENKIFVTDSLHLDVGYTFLIARDDETHKYLVYQPKNKVDCSLKYEGLNGLICELKGQFTDKRFVDAANNEKVKKFFVFGFSVSKKFRNGLTCFGSIDNLFNHKYQVIQDFPMPGTSVNGGLKLEF